jgi:hypothetical protein
MLTGEQLPTFREVVLPHNSGSNNFAGAKPKADNNNNNNNNNNNVLVFF